VYDGDWQMMTGVINATYTQLGGVTTLTFTRVITASGLNPISLTGPTYVVAAYGSSNTFGYHSFRVVRVSPGLHSVVRS
jgi:hypothetical protein